MVGGQVCVLRLSVLGGWCQGLVGNQGSVLTNRLTLETHGRGLWGLPTPRDLLLGLEQTLISPLADRSFMRPLLRLELRPIWAYLWTSLRPHARVHLPCIGGHVEGLLVLRVWCRQRFLGSSLGMGDSIGCRLQSCVPRNLCWPSESCARGSDLLGGWCRGPQNPHGRHR